MGGRNIALLTELPEILLAQTVYKHFAALRLELHPGKPFRLFIALSIQLEYQSP